MARPKRRKEAPLSESAKDLLTRIKAAVGKLPAGNKDWDPVEQLAVFAAAHSDSDDKDTKKLRIDAAKEVAKYIHPQLKGTEVSGNPDKPIEIKIRQF